jgi:ABC-type glycerol-3-phosphate transport system permease component
MPCVLVAIILGAMLGYGFARWFGMGKALAVQATLVAACFIAVERGDP